VPISAPSSASALTAHPWPAASARVGPTEIRQHCEVDAAGKPLLRAAMQQLQMSARAYHRTRSVKLARTIADPSATHCAASPWDRPGGVRTSILSALQRMDAPHRGRALSR
jgi:magnesium chelatase subunit ChlI-like protein